MHYPLLSANNKTSNTSMNESVLQKKDSKESSPDKQTDKLSVTDQYATPRCTPSPVNPSPSSSNSQSAFRVYRSPVNNDTSRPTSSSAMSPPGGAVGYADTVQADELAQEAEFMSDSESSQASQNPSQGS